MVGIKELFYEEKYRIDMVTPGKLQELQKKGCEIVSYSLAVDPAFNDLNHSSGLCRNLLSLKTVESTRSDIFRHVAFRRYFDVFSFLDRLLSPEDNI